MIYCNSMMINCDILNDIFSYLTNDLNCMTRCYFVCYKWKAVVDNNYIGIYKNYIPYDNYDEQPLFVSKSILSNMAHCNIIAYCKWKQIICKNTDTYAPYLHPYKRITHAKEKLDQFQTKELVNIPELVRNIIYKALQEKGISRENTTIIQIKKILKENHLTGYFEYSPQIYYKITGKMPLVLDFSTEKIILSMFQNVSDSFKRNHPPNRSSFLNYNYVINKLFRLLGLEQESKHITMLKSIEKLKDSDAIWKKICHDLNWKFHSSFYF
jgi:Poxvirus Late Transcription Factor VLTF3 like